MTDKLTTEVKELMTTVRRLENAVGLSEDTVRALTEQVKSLKEESVDLKEEIKSLKDASEDNDTERQMKIVIGEMQTLQQMARINDVIITGLDIKPRSYAAAAAVATEDGNEDKEEPEKVGSMESQIKDFLNERDIVFDTEDIETCYFLSKKGPKGPRTILMRFANRKKKIELMRQRKKLIETKVFLNEHLTQQNAEIAMQARKARREKKIDNTWTSNCKIFIKLNGETPNEAKVILIKTMEELANHCK